MRWAAGLCINLSPAHNACVTVCGTAIIDWSMAGGHRVSWTGKKKKKKKDGSKLDYYKLLGLQNERWMATENEIKLGGLLRPNAIACFNSKQGAKPANTCVHLAACDV